MILELFPGRGQVGAHTALYHCGPCDSQGHGALVTSTQQGGIPSKLYAAFQEGWDKKRTEQPRANINGPRVVTRGGGGGGAQYGPS